VSLPSSADFVAGRTESKDTLGGDADDDDDMVDVDCGRDFLDRQGSRDWRGGYLAVLVRKMMGGLVMREVDRKIDR